MNLKLESFLEHMQVAKTLEDLREAIFGLRDFYNIEHLVYHWVNAKGEQYGAVTYPVSWSDYYMEQGYLRVDPVVLGGFQRFHPVEWKRLDWSSKAARNFRGESIDAGVGNQGLSVPIRGPNGQFALFTASHRCDDAEWASYIEENQRDLILVGHYFNQKALELRTAKVEELGPSLSPREVDALTFLALGHNRSQAAESLSISEHTLRVYIESARFKLGAMNTTHAVAKALTQGHIVL